MERRTRKDFILYLESTLIPDLRDSGRDCTADDFETLVDFIKGFGPESRRGPFGPKPYSDFRHFLKSTLIPDLRDGGMNYTADDFAAGIRYADRVQGFNG